MRHGQALVETALVFPVLLFLLLAIIGVGFLMESTLRDQNGVDTLVDLGAHGRDWSGDVQDVNDRSGCNADPLQPDVTYPDGDQSAGDRFILTWHCHFATRWLLDGLPITVSAEGVIPGSTASPSP